MPYFYSKTTIKVSFIWAIHLALIIHFVVTVPSVIKGCHLLGPTLPVLWRIVYLKLIIIVDCMKIWPACTSTIDYQSRRWYYDCFPVNRHLACFQYFLLIVNWSYHLNLIVKQFMKQFVKQLHVNPNSKYIRIIIPIYLYFDLSFCNSTWCTVEIF